MYDLSFAVPLAVEAFHSPRTSLFHINHRQTRAFLTIFLSFLSQAILPHYIYNVRTCQSSIYIAIDNTQTTALTHPLQQDAY
ncbi:hypothetical protein V3C99_001292, partial [Haemonchus contortus]